MRAVCSNERFIELIRQVGLHGAAKELGVSIRSVNFRRRNLENKLRIAINPPKTQDKLAEFGPSEDYPHRIQVNVKDGVVLVGSDSHYFPGIVSTAHKAFVKFAKELKPDIIIKNGDELDFPGISRHAPIGWEKRPKVQTEIECTQERLSEIEDASRNSKLFWPLGNHDARFETRLATIAPEYAQVHGVHLKDHFPRWKPCWAVWVNDVVIKHRFRNGVHATRNNTLNAGKSMVTGHLHSLKVTPLSDYNGTRWGVDCGTMADPYGPQFVDYTEDSPKDWRSGFVVLTFHKGELLWPELCFVRDESKGEYEFRGKVYTV